MLDGLPGCALGSTKGTPRGTESDASWWSVTTTDIPASSAAATSSRHDMPQSTVTITSQPVCFTRSSAARVRP